MRKKQINKKGYGTKVAQPDAHIVVVCGGSGVGKTHWLTGEIRKERRVMVWDMKGEYARDFGYQKVTGKMELLEIMKTSSLARISFQSVEAKNFDFFCRAAYAWGDCTVIAEELADVTTPAKAPTGWGMVVRRGRDRALRVYGVTQRPSESDKTIIGNRTLIHCCLMPRAQDRLYMAREMDISKERLDRLQRYEWIERGQDGTIRQHIKGKTVYVT